MSHETRTTDENLEGLDRAPESLGALSGSLSALRDTILALGDNNELRAAKINSIASPEKRERVRRLFDLIPSLQTEIPLALKDLNDLLLTNARPQVESSLILPPAAQNLEPRELRPGYPIDLSKAVIVAKSSRLSRDLRQTGMSVEELLELYQSRGEDGPRILASHEAQSAAFEKLGTYFKPEQFIARSDFSPEIANAASIIISLGGDNHFQYVSHFVKSNVPVLGINSDPGRSYGALLEIKTDQSIEKHLGRLHSGDFMIEPWTRLQAKVDGIEMPLSQADVFLGEKARKEMSGHLIWITGAEPLSASGLSETPILQKSSGLLVTTGSGSSSWTRSAGRYLYPEGREFPRSAPYARFLLTEPSEALVRAETAKEHTPLVTDGFLLPGQTLHVKSLNDSEGIVSADSLDELKFDRGAHAEITIAEEAIWAVRL